MAAKNRACVCVCILNATISSSNVVCTFFALKFNTCWMCSMCNASASCSRAISLSFIAPRTLFAVVVVVIHFNSFKYSQVRSEMIMNMPFRHIFVNYPETERDFVYSRGMKVYFQHESKFVCGKRKKLFTVWKSERFNLNDDNIISFFFAAHHHLCLDTHLLCTQFAHKFK